MRTSYCVNKTREKLGKYIVSALYFCIICSYQSICQSRSLSVAPNNVKYLVNNMLCCLLYCCRQLNICFGMSNQESDCSDYLPLGLDSLSTITSDFTYLSCIMHHSLQITVLGTMLTWHPSTGILSQLTRLHIILILFLDSGKTLCHRKSRKWEFNIMMVVLWAIVYY